MGSKQELVAKFRPDHYPESNVKTYPFALSRLDDRNRRPSPFDTAVVLDVKTGRTVAIVL